MSAEFYKKLKIYKYPARLIMAVFEMFFEFMIARYTLPEMGAIWSLENKFQKWLDVEIAVCEIHCN